MLPGKKLYGTDLAFVVVRVDLNKILPFGGNGRLFKDGSDRAGWFTGTAVNALVGINIELFSRLKARFVG